MLETVLFTVLWIIAGAGVLAALTLFLVFPARRRHPDREVFRGKCVAHRGLHGAETNCPVSGLEDAKGEVERTSYNAPENTMAGFRLAAEKGYPIETDIHLTKDGKVVVFHDDTLDRLCGVKGKPEDMTLAELQQLNVLGTPEHVPSFEELLAEIDGRVPLLIEFKCANLGLSRKLCETASAILDVYGGKYAIQSFFPFVQSWYKKHRPDVMRGQLAMGFYKDGPAKFLVGALVFNAFARPDFIAYDQRNRRNVCFRLCVKLGAMPFGWTFRTAEEFEKGHGSYEVFIFENESTVKGAE